MIFIRLLFIVQFLHTHPTKSRDPLLPSFLVFWPFDFEDLVASTCSQMIILLMQMPLLRKHFENLVFWDSFRVFLYFWENYPWVEFLEHLENLMGAALHYFYKYQDFAQFFLDLIFLKLSCAFRFPSLLSFRRIYVSYMIL